MCESVSGGEQGPADPEFATEGLKYKKHLYEEAKRQGCPPPIFSEIKEALARLQGSCEGSMFFGSVTVVLKTDVTSGEGHSGKTEAVEFAYKKLALLLDVPESASPYKDVVLEHCHMRDVPPPEEALQSDAERRSYHCALRFTGPITFYAPEGSRKKTPLRQQADKVALQRLSGVLGSKEVVGANYLADPRKSGCPSVNHGHLSYYGLHGYHGHHEYHGDPGRRRPPPNHTHSPRGAYRLLRWLAVLCVCDGTCAEGPHPTRGVYSRGSATGCSLLQGLSLDPPPTAEAAPKKQQAEHWAAKEALRCLSGILSGVVGRDSSGVGLNYKGNLQELLATMEEELNQSTKLQRLTKIVLEQADLIDGLQPHWNLSAGMPEGAISTGSFYWLLWSCDPNRQH
ncbi:uncharacterized protein [Oncorhynchus clarkii lewisi]|uniref:uncharacterized protein n=1 Tax=Oncorhynchus clarkii lewisi TaxID=490388 RepID=UPI0039B9A098